MEGTAPPGFNSSCINLAGESTWRYARNRSWWYLACKKAKPQQNAHLLRSTFTFTSQNDILCFGCFQEHSPVHWQQYDQPQTVCVEAWITCMAVQCLSALATSSSTPDTIEHNPSTYTVVAHYRRCILLDTAIKGELMNESLRSCCIQLCCKQHSVEHSEPS